MPTGGDASYTPERFLTRYEELANVLGNLASRTTSMLVKYRNATVPEAEGTGLDHEIRATLESVRASMGGFKVHEALGAAMDLARTANGYVEDRAPWAQAKDPARATELDETLVTLIRALVVLCALFEPVAPDKMDELAGRLGLERAPTFADAASLALSGRTVAKGTPLFPKLEPSWMVGVDE
jgi:methionyl-tRNA synthetase